MTVDCDIPVLAERMLEKEEDRRLKMYKCSRGHNTIGIGHNLDANPVSNKAVDQIFADDLAIAIGGAHKIFGESFSTFDCNRRLALINLIFNLGEGRFRTFEKLIRAVMAGRWQQAGEEVMRSKYAFQVGDGPGGRPDRAERIALMLAENRFPY